MVRRQVFKEVKAKISGLGKQVFSISQYRIIRVVRKQGKKHGDGNSDHSYAHPQYP